MRNGHPVKPLLIRFAEVDGHLFNSRRNQEQIRFDLACQQTAREILIDDCCRAAIFAHLLRWKRAMVPEQDMEPER